MLDPEALEKMLAQGRDNAVLRFSLANAYLKQAQPRRAVEHLRAALRHDADYSAAWKLLGKALSDAGDTRAALDAYQQGIEAAERKGDKQAAKEMRVFAKRLRNALDEGS